MGDNSFTEDRSMPNQITPPPSLKREHGSERTLLMTITDKHLRRVTPYILYAWIAIALASCISAPKESIELSEIVDRQIAAMQSSHESFVRLYYGKLRSEVESFITERWTPALLTNIISAKVESGKAFRKDLDLAYGLSNFDWRTRFNTQGLNENEKAAVERTFQRMIESENATLGVVMIDFAQAAQAEISKQREAMVGPIDEQEARVLSELRAGYTDLLRASLAIKAYLASAVALTEQQDATLAKLGLLEQQRRLVDAAASASDNASRALRMTKDSKEAVDKFFEALQQP
jgi:hypothetical protein